LQSYKVNATIGAFTFGGVAQFGGTANQALGSPLVIAGDNGHAYIFRKHSCANEITAFYRDKFGAMNISNAWQHVAATVQRGAPVFPDRDGPPTTRTYLRAP